MGRRIFERYCGALLASGLLLAGCVSAQTYDALQKDYQQLQTELAGDQAEITQLQGQLKVTFKADILFPEGGWQINQSAKQTLSKIVPTLQGLQVKVDRANSRG